jgi:hypothetical protein
MRRETVELLGELEAAGVDLKTICQQLLEHIATNRIPAPEELRKRPKMNRRTMSPGERFRRELKRRGLPIYRLT